MKTIRFFLLIQLFFIGMISAGTQSIFWTSSTTDVLDTGIIEPNLTLYAKPRNPSRALTPDFGINVGLYTFDKWQIDAGLDYLFNTKNPLFFNAKIGTEEGTIFEGSPSFSFGIYNVGTSIKTHDNIFNVVFGKKIENWNMRFFVGFFRGNRTMGRERFGITGAFEWVLAEAFDKKGEKYNKALFSADYASGKNNMGGGGVALTYYMNPEFNIQAGPVWFNDAHKNGKWAWCVIFDWYIPAFQS